MNMIISVLVIAGLLFGGGATVNAARDDLPNEPLYGLKMWSEEFSLRFQDEPEQKADRLMELARIRIQEMTRLADAGQAIPDQLRQRLEQHIHQALQLCSSMDDPALDRTLLRLRDHLQEQDRDLEQLQLHAGQNTQPVLEQTRTMLRQRLQLVQAGLLDHEVFRNAARNGFRYQQADEITPPAQNQNREQNGQPTEVPGNQNAHPGGPNTNPGEPNTDPGGPNPDPGGPNTDPGGPNPDPGGPNVDPGGTNNGPGEPSTDPGGPNTDPGGPNTDTGGGNTDPGGPSSDPGGPNPDAGSGGAGGSNQGGNGSGGNTP